MNGGSDSVGVTVLCRDELFDVFDLPSLTDEPLLVLPGDVCFIPLSASVSVAEVSVLRARGPGSAPGTVVYTC